MGKCYFCGALYEGQVYRTSLCSECGKELKICYSCAFYDSTAPNQCREPRADKVVDKDRANFCDYFSPSEKGLEKNGKSDSDDARKSFEDLFS